MTAPNDFPMQHGPAIPWSLARVIYAGYAAVYGSHQTLARIAERHGFGWAEVEMLWKYPEGRKAMEKAMAVEAERQLAREDVEFLSRLRTNEPEDAAQMAHILNCLDRLT